MVSVLAPHHASAAAAYLQKAPQQGQKTTACSMLQWMRHSCRQAQFDPSIFLFELRQHLRLPLSAAGWQAGPQAAGQTQCSAARPPAGVANHQMERAAQGEPVRIRVRVRVWVRQQVQTPVQAPAQAHSVLPVHEQPQPQAQQQMQ